MSTASRSVQPPTAIEFTLNGRAQSMELRVNETILDVLRDRCGVVSVKRACGQGQCGSCVVLIDERPVSCCATPAAHLAGKTIVTIEGLPERTRETLTRCYAAAGAVQCGFCTPGFVMRSAAMLRRNPSPTREQIAHELRGHLCRCTGYVKIMDAIELAAAVLRDERPLPEVTWDATIGGRVPQLSAESAAAGQKAYITDRVVPNMLHGALRLSDHPRARIIRIDTAAARALPGVEQVLTAADVTGERVGGAIEQDWPCFVAEGETTCMVGDVLGAVAAADELTARRAAELIEIDYEVLEPLVDPQAALADGATRVHPTRSNRLSTSGFVRGQVAEALEGSAHVVRDRFHTQCVEHLYLEPEACLVQPRSDGGLAVLSQGQGIYDDRRQLARALGLAEESVHVTLVETGGAFGGKEDLSLQIQTALLAQCTGRPVRLVLSREQSIRLHPKRHPFQIDYELGCDHAGRLTAARVRMMADTGAYASVGTKVVERAVGHALGPYLVPNADVTGAAVYTNNPPNGAMRGFGVGQVAFALEQLLDRLADRVGLDSYQMRELNLLREGQTFGPGQTLRHCAGLLRTLQAVKEHFYGAKVAGLACGMKNVGLGNGKLDVGRARIDVLDGGHLRIAHGMTEMGQGLNTVAAQLACEKTGLPLGREISVEICTDDELDCGMTTASRGTVLVGNAVLDAAQKLKTDLDRVHGRVAELAGRSYRGEFVCDWTSSIEGDADEPVLHLSYGFATQVVVLDEHSGKVSKVVAAHDVGRAINTAMVEGQIEGSVHMGLGIALREELPLDGGHPQTQVRKLGVLRAHETPKIEVILVEEPEPHGPHGARGVGEAGLVPTPAAVAAALHRFDGRWRTRLPMRDNYERAAK